MEQFTFFTINTSQVRALTVKLKSINAAPIEIFDRTPDDIRDCYCGGTCNHKWGLQAGTKFKAQGKHSRNALAKLLGQDAWVRGVSHSSSASMQKAHIILLGSRSGQEAIKAFSTLEAAEDFFNAMPEMAINKNDFDKDNSSLEEVEIE